VNPGETEKVYLHCLGRLDHAIVNDESSKPLAAEVATAFKDIETRQEKFPRVGVVGEIYLRNNRFSNNYLIEKLEKLGLEVWLASFCEWPMYTSIDYLRDAFRNRDFKGFIESSLQVFTQKRDEHKIAKNFKRCVHIEDDYPVGKVMKLASKYLPVDFKGEALLSVGKAIEMANEGASGIVNAMPFNCMPGTVVSSLSKKVSEDLSGIPWLNISYEGLRDSGEDTRLEAFAEQVKAFAGSSTAKVQVSRR
jgi:predicted nucleotide-binding protein (sugar kinase/HSP70/actin superfamily)